MMFKPIEFSRPAGRAGDHQPAAFRHFTAKGDCLLVGSLFGPRAGGAKHSYLAARAVRRKYFEGISQFAHRAAKNFQIAPRRLIGREFVG
jgi:hypothetical protein